MTIRRRASIAVLASSVLLGAAVALAPTASAVGSSACSYDSPDVNFTVASDGPQLRTGPGTKYHSHGTLHKGDVFRYFCRTNPGTGLEGFKKSWSYGKLERRSKSGIPAGTRGWVYSRYLD